MGKQARNHHGLRIRPMVPFPRPRYSVRSVRRTEEAIPLHPLTTPLVMLTSTDLNCHHSTPQYEGSPLADKVLRTSTNRSTPFPVPRARNRSRERIRAWGTEYARRSAANPAAGYKDLESGNASDPLICHNLAYQYYLRTDMETRAQKAWKDD